MRLAVAIAVVAVAFSAAVYVHQRHTWTTETGRTSGGSGNGVNIFEQYDRKVWRHPSWEDPTAVLIALGGLAVAVGIAARGRHAPAL